MDRRKNRILNGECLEQISGDTFDNKLFCIHNKSVDDFYLVL